jgi:hypothetical protein
LPTPGSAWRQHHGRPHSSRRGSSRGVQWVKYRCSEGPYARSRGLRRTGWPVPGRSVAPDLVAGRPGPARVRPRRRGRRGAPSAGCGHCSGTPARPTARDRRAVVGHTSGAAWVRVMSTDLVDHYGPWASGWCWSIGEGDLDGGSVRAWCCAHHSITTREATLQAVGDALLDWRHWLEELSGRFVRVRPLLGHATDETTRDAGQHTIAGLVTVVVERTCAGLRAGPPHVILAGEPPVSRSTAGRRPRRPRRRSGGGTRG